MTITDQALVRPEQVAGHARVTDAYLLALAVARGGRLATFDRAINPAAVAGATLAHIARIAA